MPDLIAACCILHNILLGQRHEDVARLLRVLQEEGLENDRDNDGDGEEGFEVVVDRGDTRRGTAEDLRNRIAVFVAGARQGAVA
jgi:hypothetical protein